MKWAEAKAELKEIAAGNSCQIAVEDWSFSSGTEEVRFKASVHDGTDWHIAYGESLRFVLDEIRHVLGKGVADPTDEIPDDVNQAAAV